MSEKMKMKRVLDRAQHYQLCEWLKNNHEMLVANAPVIQDLCAKALVDLALIVNHSAMQEAINITGVKYNPVKTRRASPAKYATVESVASITARIDRLSADLAVIIANVKSIADALGHKLPGQQCVNTERTTLVNLNGRLS
jgi:hypothetical protein